MSSSRTSRKSRRRLRPQSHDRSPRRTLGTALDPPSVRSRCRRMIEALLSVAIYLIIVGLIYWAVTTILGVIPLPEPVRTVVNVILIVVLVLIVVYALLGLLP